MPNRRHLLAATTALCVAVTMAAVSAGPTPAQTPPGNNVPAAATAVTWQRIAIRTIYTEGQLAPPVGGLYLAFTSLAVHDAAKVAAGNSRRARAAVATAAHDVLAEYFTSSSTALANDLEASLGDIPDGPMEKQGIRIGARAAARMIASRVGDGRGDTSIVYSKPNEPGYWQPAAGGSMAAAWLGYVDPLLPIPEVSVDGPDALGTPEYAIDYAEVRDSGSLLDSDREETETATALFFSVNPILMYRTALCTLLGSKTLTLLETTRLFAAIDAAVATALIQTWRLKFEIGFWRPSQAIAAAEPELGWVPLVTNPAYSDYTSGHAAGTSPFAKVMRATFGDDVTLVLKNATLDVSRTYTSLTALENDAFHARIWGGLHFRDAMDDGYRIGHVTARRVMRELN